MQQVSSTNSAMTKLTDKVTALEHSIDFVSNQVTDQEAEIADLRRENTNINSQLREMKSRIDKIELNVENEADQRDQLENNATRLICLELSKVPKILNEP